MRAKEIVVSPLSEQEKEAYDTLGGKLQDANIQHVTGLLGTFKESLEVGA